MEHIKNTGGPSKPREMNGRILESTQQQPLVNKNKHIHKHKKPTQQSRERLTVHHSRLPDTSPHNTYTPHQRRHPSHGPLAHPCHNYSRAVDVEQQQAPFPPPMLALHRPILSGRVRLRHDRCRRPPSMLLPHFPAFSFSHTLYLGVFGIMPCSMTEWHMLTKESCH